MLCLHGGSEGKFMWLQKEPLPGVFQISTDRPGYRMVNCGESDDHTGYISEYPLMIRDDR